MPDELRVTIVGLGLIGRSAGLALRRLAERVTIVGHDPEPGLAAAAKRAGAVDRTDWNLIAAVSKADRVLLALPPDQIRDTLKAIAQDIRQGCVIVDTADVKAPVMAWAAELLPAGVHFVGGHPIVLTESMDPETARADLFDQKLFCLTPDARTDAAAVRLAADLVEATGAKPFFLDPAEHDGMAAAVEQLPRLLAGALLDVTSRSPGWRDMRKLAGNQFYTGTLITESQGKSVVAGLTANREYVLHWLDELEARLGEWRQALAEGQEETVVKAFDGARIEGERWVSAHLRGNWDETPETPLMPTSGSVFRDLLGFGKWRSAPDRGKKNRVPFVYIVRCADGTLYTGWTTDVERRMAQHNAGRGGYYTRTHRPVTLVYQEEAPDRRTAMRREWAIKKLDRSHKKRLVELQS